MVELQEKAGAPVHLALKYIAGACIDSGLIEEAETLARFLEQVRIAPRTVGLLQVWTLSQRGHFADALRHCEEFAELYPKAPEFQPLLAVLRYAGNVPTWRTVCELLVESDASTPEAKVLAGSLLDGTFGLKKKEPLDDEEPSPRVGELPADVVSYADMQVFMRV